MSFSGVKLVSPEKGPVRIKDLPLFTVFKMNGGMPYLKVEDGVIALRAGTGRGKFWALTSHRPPSQWRNLDDHREYTSEILGVLVTHSK